MDSLSPSHVPLHDIAAARRLDQAATALLGGDAFVLMQRAGEAAWQVVTQRWPKARRIAVVCGAGNNGGDGYVLARCARLAGRQVTVIHPAGGGPATPIAQRACTAYLAAGGEIGLFPCALDGFELIVDALFGIGLNRAPEGEAAALISAIDVAGVPVLALDVPSGVDAGRGIAPGVAVHAAHTVQFISAHAGLFTGDALECLGSWSLEPLDVPAAAFDGVRPVAELLHGQALAAWLPPRRLNTHKGESGRVLIAGGDHGSGGAVMLAGASALRSGTGLLSVATRAAHVAPLLARRPEAMVHAVESGDALQPMLARADVVALGPGLGQGDWARDLFARVLACGKPLVLDADALNLLAQAPQALADAVLTPHPGEAARLLGSDTATVQRDRFAAVRALVERYRCAVVLKGAGSLIAAPGQTVRVIGAGNPGMAVGGMGDLLTGVVAALRGQGLSAFDAASAGALLHSLAGDAAAGELGQRGLLPSDLLQHLHRLANPRRA